MGVNSAVATARVKIVCVVVGALFARALLPRLPGLLERGPLGLGYKLENEEPRHEAHAREYPENLLGAEGSGLTHMMRNLELERLTLAAMSTGIAERCLDIMIKYGAERVAFGQPINRYGQIQRYIADSFAMTQAARCLVYQVALNVGPDIRNRIGSDAAKLFAAPVGKQVADHAMQVMGGAGYCREYPIERLLRDAKLLEIGGGTLESHQKNLTKDLTRLFTC